MLCYTVLASRGGAEMPIMQKGDFVPPAHMITPTREREIAAYVWVHPDDER